ncbi:hypothetical protein I3F58_12300 [Streptomyces sp. MUM 203J]|uniref:hypothetical protein n=1 Tax=Streptomyces sp. MUM 203J TaxID=2791990 RepID=UPI001F04A40E|nr:hypothetical protein [Streptomyces sp. MUM 203J]MCH0540336.1 hypothetical protein [Streptomyces sp. MUM 203J]
MAFDVICLITEWAPAVAACRESRGINFYWNAPENPNGDDLPFATERNYRGFDFIEASFYYEILRDQLPTLPRNKADAFLGCVLMDFGQDCPELPEDLADDVGIELPCDEIYYSMRPATVRTVLERMRAVPWAEIEQAAHDADMPSPIRKYDIRDIEHFLFIIEMHQRWLDEAARTGRGLIVLRSQ